MTNDSVRYVLFDFDGTLIDSMPFLEKNAITLLVRHFSYSEKEARSKYRETTGLPFIQQMDIISPNHPDNPEIVEEFEKMKLELIYEQQPFDDALDVLNQLKLENYLVGISSGTIESIIKTYLKNINFDIVNDILGFRPGFEKGADHFNYIMEIHNLERTQILFIGDSLHDAKRAKNNQISFIGKRGMFNQSDFNTIIPNCRIITDLKGIFELL